jgi:type II secretory pathway component GspD/PulD (secretin)
MEVSETQQVRMDYINATMARSLLSLPFQQYVQAENDPNGRTLTVTAHPKLMKRIVDELNALDFEPQQVLLEARIVVMERSNLLNIGVDWGWPTISEGAFTNDHKGLLDGDLAGELIWGIEIGYSTSAQFTNALDQVLNLLVVNNEAQILSRPKVFAQDGKLARIEVLTEDYYILYASELSANYYSRQEMERIVSGTILSITPFIGDNNDIVLEMAIEISDSTPSPRDSTLPRVTRRKTQNSLRIDDGGTVAVAGLAENRASVSLRKVPGLSGLPLIGELFKSKSDEDSYKEVAVFVTASIVRESNPSYNDLTQRGATTMRTPIAGGASLYDSRFNGSSSGMYDMTQPARGSQPIERGRIPAELDRERRPAYPDQNTYGGGYNDYGNSGFAPVRSAQDEYKDRLRENLANESGGFYGY